MLTDTIDCLIIDDDPFIQNLLRDKLKRYFPEVTVLNIASSGAEGIEYIHSHSPDLIFLDVEMADMTGFEMLEKLEKIDFRTIFITSYSHYAIRAIRFNALDYLVKPFDLGELKQAISRFQSQENNNQEAQKLKQALKNLRSGNSADQILTLHTQEGEIRLALKNIIRIEGERNYSYLYLTKDKRILTSKTLGEFEELLNDKGFFRCHKSHLVNFLHIKSYITRTAMILSDDHEIPVSRRKKDEFRNWYENYIQ